MGHDTGLDKSYYRGMKDQLKASYSKAIDVLTIDQSKKLAFENNQLKADLGEIHLLKKQIEEMKEDNLYRDVIQLSSIGHNPTIIASFLKLPLGTINHIIKEHNADDIFFTNSKKSK